MLTFVLGLVLVFAAIAVVVRLAAVVRHDRSLTTPRSHTHEIDPHSARGYRFV